MEHATRSIGANIKRLRKAKGLTADALARSVGITENALRKLEAGHSKEPRFSTGLRLATALAIEPRALMRPAKQKRPAAPDLSDIIGRLRSLRGRLRHRGVEHLSIFGSVARGDATEKSDIDIVIEPEADIVFDLVDLGLVSDSIQEALKTKVDVHTLKTIARTRFGREALEEAVRVF